MEDDLHVISYVTQSLKDLHSPCLDFHIPLPFLTILSSFLNSNLIILLLIIQNLICHIKAQFYKTHCNCYLRLEVLYQILENKLLLQNL